ncbi:hypothetical protein LPB41_05955 [Thalassospira sp. MA62]|nr:hypothetical protein [Thalassospira sp. MA62]
MRSCETGIGTYTNDAIRFNGLVATKCPDRRKALPPTLQAGLYQAYLVM